MNRPGCYQPERQLLDGIRTRQTEAPFHGARSSCFGVFLRLSPSVGASLTFPLSHVSSPRSSNRTCRFPASGSHPGSCPSPTESPARTVPVGVARSPARVRGAHVSPTPTGRRGAATGKAARSFPTARLFPLSRPTGPRLPSLPHAAPSGLSGHLAEVLDFRHSPRPLPPSCAIPKPRPLRSAGVTRPLRYYGPIRHPAGPGCPSRAPGGRVRATDGASRVASVPLSHACRRQYPGGCGSVPVSLTSQPANGLPLGNGGSASALAFSRPARRSRLVLARRVAEPPKAALCHQSASAHFVTSMNRPGRYQPERQLLRGFRTH